jgi:uncharacterized membrane protein YdjX (TVP38/TMEM64 family)
MAREVCAVDGIPSSPAAPPGSGGRLACRTARRGPLVRAAAVGYLSLVQLRAALAVLASLTGIALFGWALRARLGLGGSSAEIEAAVAALGWRGPLLFLSLVTFRQFLALPAAVVLSVGGLCFGAALGTLLGAVGIVVSGLGKFGLARAVGRRWLGARLARFEARIERLGPALIGVSTAHPFGILSPFHWAAGLSSLRPAPFAVALCLGAPVRAFAYSAFGATLTEPGTFEFRLAVAGLVAAGVVPLALPSVRAWLFAREAATP